MRRKKRVKLHPVLAAIKKRQREISHLVATAQLIGLDLSEVMPSAAMRRAKRMTAEQARTYYAELQAPL